MLKIRHIASLVVVSMLLVTTTATAVVTNFSIDVAQSIEDGIAQLDALGAYSNPSSAGDAAGLALLALMEKRQSVDPNDPAQGYSSASLADQARMENVVHYILFQGALSGFYSFRDGQNMMALSLYLRTGGPDPAYAPESVIDGINRLFDRSIQAQNALGYWCYHDNFSCDSSTTTQFVVSGLAAVRAVYSDLAWSDPGRLAELNAALALTRSAYASANQTGGPGGACDALERGHGYIRMHAPGDSTGGSAGENTLQATSAGTFAQLVGGADLNDPSVQQYLRWIFNRYRYTSIVPHQWNELSYYYFLWASSKAFGYIDASGVLPNAGNLTVADMGTGLAGFCANNQVNRNPETDSQVPRFGTAGAGYYSGHPAGFYYDYAYTLLSTQTGLAGSPGDYTGNGRWNVFSGLSYAILVLERSFGGVPPSVINADIDIKFCSDPNAYNCKKKGVLPVTIFGTDSFDVTDIDLTTVQLCLEDDLSLCAEAPANFSVADRGTPPDDLGTDQCAMVEDPPLSGIYVEQATPDGFADLDVAFDVSEVKAILYGEGSEAGDFCDEGAKGDVSESLVIIGEMTSGVEFYSVPRDDPAIDQLLKVNK